jgi:hypothetical protein
MTLKQDRAKLAEVKRTLAKKYENLATTVHSIPRRKKYCHQAEKFRRQADDLGRP